MTSPWQAQALGQGLFCSSLQGSWEKEVGQPEPICPRPHVRVREFSQNLEPPGQSLSTSVGVSLLLPFLGFPSR